MLLLAIDSSGKSGSIALADAGDDHPGNSDVRVIELMSLSGGTFSAQLVPQIAVLLSNNGFTKHEIRAFAVVSGPGSFTGLRIGLAAVKALAEVLEKPIVAVSLLHLCVFASSLQGKAMAALDAGRGDVYVGEYETDSGQAPCESMLSRAEFISHAKGWRVVTPDSALADVCDSAGLPVQRILPISAADVARLGWKKYQRGETVTTEKLEANYIRRTDAEMLGKVGS